MKLRDMLISVVVKILSSVQIFIASVMNLRSLSVMISHSYAFHVELDKLTVVFLSVCVQVLEDELISKHMKTIVEVSRVSWRVSTPIPTLHDIITNSLQIGKCALSQCLISTRELYHNISGH